MVENNLNVDYWQEHYTNQQTGWDIGSVSRPIQEYIDQLRNKDLRILIPGCGNAYEGSYLWEKGFKNVYLLDFAEAPKQRFLAKHPDFPESQWLSTDFFELKESFDLILEQTLFCALNPSLRMKYAEKAASLLVPAGKLVGVLFDRDFEGGPPFGGSRTEYLNYFQVHFKTVQMENCHNSIDPRKGTELFVKMIK